jgi:Flp pilus assembly pilin Flp
VSRFIHEESGIQHAEEALLLALIGVAAVLTAAAAASSPIA